LGPGAGIGERFLGGLRRIGTLPAALLLLTALLLSGDCGGSGGSGRSYPGAAAETDRTASALMAETGATALSVALYDGGRLAWTREYGVTDRASGRSVTPTTLFGFGSCSKMIATVAAMILVDRGRLSLDRSLTEVLPDFRMISPSSRTVRWSSPPGRTGRARGS